MLNNSVYIANASILIIDGGSLMIGSNTTIEFAPERVIRVLGDGRFSIEGPTVLKSTSNFWGGILLENSYETSISKAVIEGASVGVHVKSSGNLVILDSILKEVSSDGIYLESSSTPDHVTLLSNVQIDGPGGSGIYAPYFMGSLTLSNSTIIDASAYGVYVNSWYSSRVALLDNSIAMVKASWTSVYVTYSLIANITGNDMTCLYQCLYLYAGAETIVDQNIFRGVLDPPSYYTQPVYIRWDRWDASSFSLQSNTIQNWNTYYDALYAYVAQHSGGSGSVMLKSNRFINVSAASIFNLVFPSSTSPVNVANIFESDLIATGTSCPSAFCISDWPDSCGAGACTLIGNIFNFSAPAGQYHMVVSKSAQTVPMIDASLSYWGTSDESNLTETIFDGRDDIALTTIDYLPYLLTHDSDGERRSVALHLLLFVLFLVLLDKPLNFAPFTAIAAQTKLL